MTSKYNARPTVVDGIRFDSLREAERYYELVILQKAREIELMEVHPRFEIIKGFEIDGKKIRPTFYEADFRYWDKKTRRMVVEDVKGMETQVFKIKRKLFLLQYGLEYDFRIIK